MNDFITMSDIHNKMSEYVKYSKAKHDKGYVSTVTVSPHTNTVTVWMRYKQYFSYPYEFTFKTFMHTTVEVIYKYAFEDFNIRLEEIRNFNAGGV